MNHPLKHEHSSSYIVFSNQQSTANSSVLHPESVLTKVLEDNDLKRRRQWTKEEDNALREAVDLEHPDGCVPYKWLEVSRHIPGRSNKDCRKRWYNKMSSPLASKGSWSREEDAALMRAVEMYGTKWQLVSSVVGTRKGCQCARRWYDTLNPAIDKAPWTQEEDTLLLALVNEHGKKWSYISQTYFPGRTGLAAKNRYGSPRSSVTG
ncbi:Homeodomain-like protein [Cyathus striatus]|nr:Homeodomain-like protein [Cyathus striatus]